MRRHDEDRWIELAFDELSGLDADELHRLAETDPRAAEAVRSYAAIREGLASLRDVPEMQLSCDRLRDAILAGGLKEPRASWWTWLAIPTAVAASAFLLTLALRQPNTVPVVAVSAVGTPNMQPTMVPTLERTPQPAFDTMASRSVGSPLGDVKFDLGNSDIQPAPKPTPKVITANRGTKARVAPKAEARVAKREVDVAPRPSVDVTPMGLTAEGSGSAADSAANTIIFISSDQDNVTGTQRATEVESVSNVVIGG